MSRINEARPAAGAVVAVGAAVVVGPAAVVVGPEPAGPGRVVAGAARTVVLVDGGAPCFLALEHADPRASSAQPVAIAQRVRTHLQASAA